MGQQTIAIDFDGVLHKYSEGWKDGAIYDGPVDGAVEAIAKMNRKGLRLIIFTARRDLERIREWCRDWFDGWEPEITNEKPIASMYIDDRAIRFTNWKDVMNYF